MKALKALRMVARSDLKGFEKMKAEEAQDILLLLDDRGYLDVKPNVDEALARKEDCEDLEKDIPKEIDRLFKYDDKLDDPLKDGNLVRKENYEDIRQLLKIFVLIFLLI